MGGTAASRAWATAIGLIASAVLHGHARSQASPEPIILEPTETVRLEHDDRVARIKRATAALGLAPAPTYSETVVPAARMPADFAVDTPVLRVVFAERSLFDTDQSALRPEGEAVLRAIAEALKGEAPDTAVFVAGHTDDRGSEPHNHNLSIARAEAVVSRLLAAGVGQAALWRVGFGESVPLYPNTSDGHRAFNRRVEFLFASRTEPVLEVLKRQLDTICVSSNAEASRRCKREVEVRASFEAVQVVANRQTAAVARTAPAARVAAGRRSAASAASRAVKAPVLLAQARVGAAAARPKVDLVLAPKRISFDLRARRYDLNIPTRAAGAAGGR